MSIRKGSRTIASSVPITEWGSVDGTLTDQADLKSALDSKAPSYSPTFTGTPLAPTAPVGAGNNQIATTKYVQDALLNAGSDLPDQTGQSGKFLTTNGTLPSWATVDALPSQSGKSGKFLTTNGTSASWSDLTGVVHTTGNETVNGIKTFNSSIIVKRALNSETSEELNEIQFQKKDTTSRAGGVRNRLTSGENITEIYVADGGTYKNGIIVSDNGTSVNAYLANQQAASSDNNAKWIATTGWVNSPTLSTNVVHRSGDETVAGQKTFTSNLIIKSSVAEKAVVPSTNSFYGLALNDKNNAEVGVVYLRDTSTEREMVMKAHAFDGTSQNYIKVGFDTSSNSYTYAPTPAANSNDNNIATTSWVNTKVSGVTLSAGTNIEIDNSKNINYTGPRYYRLGTRTWTYAQWTQYCERGITTNISPSFTVTGIKAGDLVTVEGICSDRGNANALAWGIAQGTPASDTGNVSVTFLGLNIQNDAGLVHLAGDETITGYKYFTNAGAPIVLKNNDLEQMTNPSAYSEQMVVGYDKNGIRIGSFGIGMADNGNSRCYLAASKKINGTWVYSVVDTYVDKTGNTWAVAPKPSSTTDNTNKIATTSWVVDVLQAIYPVGSLYMGTQNSCPLSAFFGTWTLVSAGNALWTGNGTSGSGTTTNANYANAAANTTIAAGLPNITGTFNAGGHQVSPQESGAFYIDALRQSGNSGNDNYAVKFGFSAANSNSIYGTSSTVQPPAYVVNVWRRTA